MFKNTAQGVLTVPWSEYVLIGRMTFKDAISKAELGTKPACFCLYLFGGGLHACMRICL